MCIHITGNVLTLLVSQRVGMLGNPVADHLLERVHSVAVGHRAKAVVAPPAKVEAKAVARAEARAVVLVAVLAVVVVLVVLAVTQCTPVSSIPW